MSRTSLLRTITAVFLVGGLLVGGLAGFGQARSPQAIRVKWGDTLWGLSQRYRVNMNQLATANHMRVSDVLLAGRTIYVPPGAGGAGAPGTAAAGTGQNGGGVAAAQQAERTFCATYKPPTGPRGRLPADLSSNPSLLALRSVFSKWGAKYRVPADLMEAEAWQESGWSNTVVSPSGAVGIGQLLPATAAFVNQSRGTHLKLDVTSDNIEMMAAFLSYLLRSTGGQVCRAVAAYYQGLGNLQRHGVLPFSQTYVRNVLSLRPRFA